MGNQVSEKKALKEVDISSTNLSHFGKVSEKKYVWESKIEYFYICPGYEDNSDLLDGYDLAIGLFKEYFVQVSMSDDSYLSHIEKENPRPGDIIRVIGYPGEKNGELFEMRGTIQQIIKNGGDNQAILYDDIETTSGQSGSPVYLKRGDR